jgi:putative redox protein
MSETFEASVTVKESGNGNIGQIVTIGHHIMGADEPEKLGGRDTGPSPYEYLLAALGSCTSMTIRLYANRRSLPLEHISVALRHDKVPGETGGPSADRFERVITLTGALTEEQRAKLLEIAEKCPVSQTLQRGSAIVSRLG